MTDADIAALVERLRKIALIPDPLTTAREAADALESLQAEAAAKQHTLEEYYEEVSTLREFLETAEARAEKAEAELKRLLPFVPAYPYGHPYREAQRQAMKEAREVLEHD